MKQKKHIPAPEVISDYRCLQCSKPAVDDKNGSRCEEHLVKSLWGDLSVWGNWLDKALGDTAFSPPTGIFQIDSLPSMSPSYGAADKDVSSLAKLTQVYMGRQLGKSDMAARYFEKHFRMEMPMKPPATKGNVQYNTQLA